MTSGIATLKKRRKVKVDFTVFSYYSDFLRFIMNVKYSPSSIVIENSNLQASVFNYKASKSVLAKIARNVGQNQACSQITIDLCKELFIDSEIHDISPLDKGGKWNHERFVMECMERNHAYDVKSNQDQRDAYKLALIGLKDDSGVYWGIDPSFRNKGMVLCQIIVDGNV